MPDSPRFTSRRATFVILTMLAVGVGVARPRGESSVVSQTPSLEQILTRASEYVGRYFDVMSNLTAEERYVQISRGLRQMTINPRGGGYPTTSTAPAVGDERRELRSDIVLVRVGPPLEWRVYRDVFAVDGKPVRDRAARLTRLLLEPVEKAQEQAERISAESSRFNVSEVGRVLNVPGLPLVFLQPSLATRFDFALDKRDTGTVWIVKFTESVQPTVFRHDRYADNPSSGRFWIDALTGEISRSEHHVEPAGTGIKATFTSEFRLNERFGVAVPVGMREQLSTGMQADYKQIEGAATYSNYRKFDVSTNDKGIQPPAKPASIR